MSSDRTPLRAAGARLSASDLYAASNALFLQSIKLSQMDRATSAHRVDATFRRICQFIEPTVSLEMGARAGFSQWIKTALPSVRAFSIGSSLDSAETIASHGIERIASDPASAPTKLSWIQHAIPAPLAGKPASSLDQLMLLRDNDRTVVKIELSSNHQAILTCAKKVLENALAVSIEVANLAHQPGEWLDADVGAYLIELGFLPAFRDHFRPRRFNYAFLKPALFEQPKISQQIAKVFAPAISADIAYTDKPLSALPSPRGPVVLQGDQLSPTTDTFTVAIFAIPRGGTTMVAGVARRCGLFIGSDLPANLEDQDFVYKNLDHMAAAAAERDASRKAWGWKYPRAADYLPQLLPKLRNPRLVMVWRDLLAAGARGVLRGSAPQESLRAASRILNKNLQIVADCKVPILHVSYEKAIRDPVPFIEALAAFVGGKRPPNLDEVVAFMEPGSYKPVDEQE